MKTLTLLFILLFALNVFPQDTKQETPTAPYDVINLKFVIEGLPNAEDVGFDNPKSTWQFKYELRFVDDDRKIDSVAKSFSEIPNETQTERSKRITKNNKEFDKIWKKLGIIVVKGKISKTQLIEAKNREITIPVKLTPQVLNILAKSSLNWDNPEFRLKVSGKVSLKTKDNLQFKQKFTPSWVCSTKLIDKKNNQFSWMMNTCGAYTGIVREDGKIIFGLSSRL